jgi:protein-disulfide isomerase
MSVRSLPVSSLIAGAALALLAACGQTQAPPVSTNPNVKINPVLEDVILGDPKAPVKIVEYGSFACPHCRDFWIQRMPALRKQYIDTGKANYVFHDLALSGASALAQAAGAIVRCAGKDKYFDVVQDLFEHQYDIAVAAQTAGGAGQALAAIGERAGLTREQVLACIDSPAIDAFMKKQQAETPKSVQGFPTVMVNGEEVKAADPTKELQAEDVARAIEAKLGGTPAAAPAKPPG